jgi:hypothetical protein
METLHAGRRRSLPPVPRSGADDGRPDAGQSFVAELRAAAPVFAAAAGAESAVVPEAVPPARHRRSRCRVVLRYADGGEVDVTFVGPTGRPGRARVGFDVRIQQWLVAGRPRDGAWVLPDPTAADGVAVDVDAWLATG